MKTEKISADFYPARYLQVHFAYLNSLALETKQRLCALFSLMDLLNRIK